ncbi:hypothetical protein [Aquamicrobium sp.]|uniref:hypothetical protein n=1 Tax=Aquamicrobium sp. TaxID=1872579 RepID=UPI00258B6FAA|nr:hypothetical protein [Aquamicrobium sp.]MCK9549201.1 hypothetical protein [Aquamicrobium sp.]
MAFPNGHNKGPSWREAIDARKAMLRNVVEGETLTYPEMTKILGVKITGGGENELQVALRELHKEGIAFTNVSGEGYTRLDPTKSVVVKGNGFRLKARRVTKRGLTLLNNIDDSAVDRSSRPNKWALVALLETIKRTTHGNSVNASVKKMSMAEEEKNRLKRQLSGEIIG